MAVLKLKTEYNLSGGNSKIFGDQVVTKVVNDEKIESLWLDVKSKLRRRGTTYTYTQIGDD